MRWYDYLAAFIVADIATVFLFTIPLFGGIFTYIVCKYGWDAYCEYRKEMET